jgi:asparagine synthase (glutamine-hydrolysing)
MPQFGRRLYKFSELLAADRRELYAAQVEHWRDGIVLGAENAPSIPLTDPSWWAKDLSLTERMIYLDTLSYLPNDLMVKADRAGMAASLEIRAPLLDRRVIEYAWRLPLRMKVRMEGKAPTGKWLLRQVLARHMPAGLYDRPKQGFSVPVEQWLRGPLKDWAEGLLDEKRLREDGLLDPGAVRAMWAAYLSGQYQHANRLWTVLMFRAWQEKWQKQAQKQAA